MKNKYIDLIEQTFDFPQDEFEVIDWPGIFDVPYTPFAEAVDETFNDPTYGKVVLEF